MSQKPSRRPVLLINLGGSMGGVETYVEGLSQILSTDYDVIVLCALTELAATLRQHGAQVFTVPLFQRMRTLRFIAAFFVLMWILVRYRISVVQINGFLESLVLVPARLLGCRTVYTKHLPSNLELFRWYRNPLRYIARYFSQRLCALATRIVCVSETIGRIYSSQLPASRVMVIRNWVHSVPFTSSTGARTDGRISLLFLGRLEKYKGAQLLLDAVRTIDNIHVTFVGTGSYQDELHTLAEGISATFVGFQSDPAPFYRAADIFVMPSFGPEGMPLAALEAMSYGLPCVFSDLLVHAEITGNGRAASLFRRGDSRDLRAALITLIEDDQLRCRLGREARRMILERFSFDTAQQAYLSLFSELCAPKQASMGLQADKVHFG